MEGDFIKINEWLLPLSWLYGLVVKCRNLLFDVGILKSRSFKVPVVSVGNITVGGTGKTPHVEYLIKLLQPQFKVAVLSRGYKRKSHGYVIADEHSTVRDIGDEPYQMKQKFPGTTIAVDKNRCHGIDQLTTNDKDLDVILLDDAFQHRYVKPGINILLVDYHRLIIYDKLLPAGRLREPLSGKDRADIVIVTKCPENLKPMEFRVITKAMNLFPYQHLYFTTLEYGHLKPAFNTAKDATPIELNELKNYNVLLLTGIASPKQMIHDLKDYTAHLTPIAYKDHHQFKQKDLAHVCKAFEELPSPKIIITTEKDATRLKALNTISDDIKNNLYVLPVNIKFMLEQTEMFNDNIKGYVFTNSRNSILTKGKSNYEPKSKKRSEKKNRTISFRN